MPAPKGNKYTEKWTRERVLKYVTDMLHDIKQDPSINYIGDVLIKYDLYKQIWSYWQTKFKDDSEVFEPIKRANQILEARVYTGALTGKYKAGVAIFILKNCHGWTDGRSIHHKGNISPSKRDLSVLTTTEIKTLIAIENKLTA